MEKTPRGPYYTQDLEWYAARRRLILKARREGQTLASIGKTWGITRARVNQIITRELSSRPRDPAVLSEVVQCEECGTGGLDPVVNVCGEWIGTPDNGYRCPDVLCDNCRSLEESNAD